MTMRCYVPDLSDKLIELPATEARHASRSRRLSVGDALHLFDGKGAEATGIIETADRNRVCVHVKKIQQRQRPRPWVTLGVALPKGPRQDVLIEKCSELGVACIQPLETQRSVASANEHKISKWRSRTIEAAKQSGQCFLPEIKQISHLEDLRDSLSGYESVVLAVTATNADELTDSGQQSPKSMVSLLPALARSQTVLALIGPEGGWSEAEQAFLIKAGARPVSLGPATLRIETAAIVILGFLHAVSI